MVVDATHPCARYPEVASACCSRLGLPYLRLARPGWSPGPGERWRRFAAIEEAAASVPTTARLLAATGRKSQPALESCHAQLIALRVADPPEAGGWGEGRIYLRSSRSPSIESEMALLRSHSISHLLTRDAGGAEGRAKLDAARVLGIEVLMVERPVTSPRAGARSVDEALLWLARLAEARPGTAPDGAASREILFR